MCTYSILEGLNPIQKKAVTHENGPLLVLSGAGSGKTRVITHRIACLIRDRGVEPWQILALTFTNKAAEEMKNRVAILLGMKSLRMWIGTFHSICARILRINAQTLGFTSRFIIFDGLDQKSIIRRIMKEMGISKDTISPDKVLYEINSAKQELIHYSFFNNIDNPEKKMIGRIFKKYQDRLIRSNSMDFGDLIFNVVKLLDEHPDIRKQYQSRFRHILVDEYQDTDPSQHALVELLTGDEKNICVVGDDNQSIYRFRGAEVENVLDFERSFPGAKVLHMMQNYRSTKHILGAANDVIGHNLNRRFCERLYSELGEGQRVIHYTARNSFNEADFIIDIIQDRVRRDNRSYKDFAVFYRTHSQSRVLEEKLLKRDIPHQVVGGIAFYSRKEIKDVVAYLRLVSNPLEDVSLTRVINIPPRGIGQASVNKLSNVADQSSLRLWEVLEKATGIEDFSLSLARKFLKFRNIIEDLRESGREMTPSELIRLVIEKSSYLEFLGRLSPLEAGTRQENVEELVTIAAEFEKEQPEGGLDGFLEKVSLVTDIDRWADRDDKFPLMTLHAAKGLEFPVVFITGLEEGLLPYEKGKPANEDSEEELEEERRLFYVGVTRAQEELFLTTSIERARYGKVDRQIESRFVQEISREHLRRVLSARSC